MRIFGPGIKKVYEKKVLIEKDLRIDSSLDFTGLNIFEEARIRKMCGYGYHANKMKIFKCGMYISYGIRWSDINQIFPIWNMSDNSFRALLFGFWKLYFKVSYQRNHSFNQSRFLPFRNWKPLWRFYQLIF